MNWTKKKTSRFTLWMLLIFAVFYIAGVFLGQVAAGAVSPGLQSELNRYLMDYVYLDKKQISVAETAWSTLVLYLRYPLAAFLSGFASVGVVLLPCLGVLLGLGLSFSVSCFTVAFGSAGLLLSVASFGLRALVTLPCFLLVAIPAWDASYGLLALSFGRGRRIATAGYSRADWGRFAAVIGILLAGTCADLLLTPWFLEQVLT